MVQVLKVRYYAARRDQQWKRERWRLDGGGEGGDLGGGGLRVLIWYVTGLGN